MIAAETDQALDRHALVMAVWLAGGLVAATLFHYGLGAASPAFLLAAFGMVLAAFAGHVIVNVVYGTAFTPRELALGLVLYAAALVGFVLATLVSPDFTTLAFWPGSGGFLAIFAAVIFYMVTTTGVRGAFEAFDVVRSFRAPPRRTAGEELE
jgi:hypothetical protein